ncbi:MAG: ABC transporter permease [Caldilineaceae bacterium]|nr:ABC transporter permease [Caldilineaceae bacterium]
MNAVTRGLGQLIRYPSAIIGLILIATLIGISICTPIVLPYSEAIALWRGGDNVWLETPRNAQPRWVNLFPGVNLPDTIVLDSRDQPEMKQSEQVSDDIRDVTFAFTFDYPYDEFPQDLSVFFEAEFDEKRPLVEMLWITPDGREIRLGDLTVQGRETYNVLQDDRLARRLRDVPPLVGLFGVPESEPPTPLQGTYELQVAGLLFEEDADLDAKMVVYGQVYGLAGTDHRRRDLMVALLWGTPIALAFGLLAAVGSTVSTMVIAAIGVWFGEWTDAAIQRITEVNLILPLLPILIMIGTFYSRSVWVMLGAVILLSVFSAGIKTYRAIFLQIKESPYIEAAQAYGAGNFRIIFLYLIPRLVPILIPNFVIGIPAYVFLEATLGLLGLGDPILPTWGKVLSEARANGALYQGYYYWMLEPAALLMITGLGFAMVGFTLDRIFNPRLRDL